MEMNLSMVVFLMVAADSVNMVDIHSQGAATFGFGMLTMCLRNSLEVESDDPFFGRAGSLRSNGFGFRASFGADPFLATLLAEVLVEPALQALAAHRLVQEVAVVFLRT
jgi:hypothetical protein